MPTRTDSWPTGTPSWVDLSVPDLAAAKEFYGSVFGYRYEPIEGAPPDYTIIHFDEARDGEPVGGIGGMMSWPAARAEPPASAGLPHRRGATPNDEDLR